MANFMLDSVVKYACSCGNVHPISRLFFCRHCLKLRCGFCVCHEVDSHFCSNCLENIPSSEARHKKNCCANCFDCPCCQHTLTARATTVVVQRKPDETPKEKEGETAGGSSSAAKPLTKKMYYLTCLACRWTSRDVGIPDQSVATGAWPDNDCAYQTRFNTLLEYYQAVVLQDKQEKQEYMRRKAPKVHKFPSLTDRTGLTVSMIRRQIGWADKTPQKAKPINITPAAPTDDVPDLPENVFTQKVNLLNVTTIKQRHAQPGEQPFSVNKIYPQRRFLWIKRSLRCRQCEHNVIKPEYHPTSIKYRIQLFAFYHVPDVLLVRREKPMLAGKECWVILKLTNPTMHDMEIQIIGLPNKEEELSMIEEFRQACNVKDTMTTIGGVGAVTDSIKMPTTPTVLTRQVSLTEEPRIVSKKATADLQSVDVKFVLNQRDDATEFDEEEQEKREEPSFVVWRKANRASIKLRFTPFADLQPDDEVTLGFTLQYTYVNTVANTAEKKDPTPHDLSARVYVNVGKIDA